MARAGRGFRRWLAAVVFGASAASAAAPWRHEATGAELPDRLAGWERGGVANPESSRRGAGVAVPYRAPGIHATVYLYTAGVAAVPEDLKSPIVQRHLEEIAEAVVRFGQMNGFMDIKQPRPRTVAWGEGAPEIKALRVAFTYAQDGVKKISHLHLTTFKGHFLKVRVTFNRAGGEESEAREALFLADLAALLRGAAPGFE